LPLVLLAVLSVVGGFFNTPFRTALEHFLEPSFEGVTLAHPPEGWGMFAILAGLSVAAGLAGVAAAYFAYNRPADLWRRFEDAFGPLWSLWRNGYRVDEIYGATVVKPGLRLAEETAFRFDLPVIDGAVNGAGRLVRAVASKARAIQPGLVRSYGVVFTAGTLAVLAWMVWRGS
jgi:NADH-quinone oxidoreductase subunit L